MARRWILAFSLLPIVGCGVTSTSDGGTPVPTIEDAGTSPGIDGGAGPGGSGGSGGGGSGGGSGDLGAGPAHFSTVPPHGTLPSESQCAAWVNAQPTSENMPANATANATTPTSEWLTAYYAHPDQDLANNGGALYENRVTGAFTGSTDMILRWAACKWGIDEDVVRAEAWEESSWRMSLHADGATGAECHSANVAVGAPNYWADPSPCQPSRGILQCRLTYFNLYPYSDSSTALNADYRMARQRICMDGGIPWFASLETTDWGKYPPSDTDAALYGCMNAWYSGSWVNDSNNYVNNLKTILAAKSWPH
jgi:autotransporter family porin